MVRPVCVYGVQAVFRGALSLQSGGSVAGHVLIEGVNVRFIL